MRLFYHDSGRTVPCLHGRKPGRMRTLQVDRESPRPRARCEWTRRGTHCARLRAEVQMATVASLREHLVEELNDLHNAEQQLIEALPQMAQRATSRTYAQGVGEKSVAKLLEQTLREEKAADQKLTRIAEGSVNRKAVNEWQERSGGGALQRGTRWAGSTIGAAMKRVRPRAQAA